MASDFPGLPATVLDVCAGERLPVRLPQTCPDCSSVPGGQGVAGSNPAVPTIFRTPWGPSGNQVGTILSIPKGRADNPSLGEWLMAALGRSRMARACERVSRPRAALAANMQGQVPHSRRGTTGRLAAGALGHDRAVRVAAARPTTRTSQSSANRANGLGSGSAAGLPALRSVRPGRAPVTLLICRAAKNDHLQTITSTCRSPPHAETHLMCDGSASLDVRHHPRDLVGVELRWLG
jgi:hypothetical protein